MADHRYTQADFDRAEAAWFKAKARGADPATLDGLAARMNYIWSALHEEKGE